MFFLKLKMENHFAISRYRAITRGGIGLLDPPAGAGLGQALPEGSDRASTDDDETAKERPRSLDRESVLEQEQLIGLSAKHGSADDDAHVDGGLNGGCGSIESFREWGPKALPFVLLFSCIQACTWLVMRAIMVIILTMKDFIPFQH